MLSSKMPRVAFNLLSFFYSECHYADCHYAKCLYAECRGAAFSVLPYIINEDLKKLALPFNFYSRLRDSKKLVPKLN